jgi:hypothetical protein
MKYILIGLFATLAIPSFSQEKDKEVMIKKIFTVLQQKDEAGFIKLFPDAEIMKEFVLKQIGKDNAGEDTLSDEYKTMLADISDSSLQKEFGEMFREIIEKGEDKGVEWEKTNFVSFTADTSVEEDSEMARLEGKIYFNIDKIEYFLKYDEIIWFENLGWYGVSIDRIDEKSKENDPEEIDWKAADSTMMMDSAAAVMDTAMAAPQTAPVIKPSKNGKAPVKNNTVKPKTQSPAQKQE